MILCKLPHLQNYHVSIMIISLNFIIILKKKEIVESIIKVKHTKHIITLYTLLHHTTYYAIINTKH